MVDVCYLRLGGISLEASVFDTQSIALQLLVGVTEPKSVTLQELTYRAKSTSGSCECTLHNTALNYVMISCVIQSRF